MSGFTQVTGQVKDSAGNLYGGCRILASFVGQSTTPGAGPYLLNGLPSGIFPTVLAEQSDSLGNFSFLLADNNQVQPTPSQWSFTIVSLDGTKSFNLLITITGASQNITTALQAVAPPLTPVIGGTVSTSLIPQTATGLTLGNSGQRWDGFLRNLFASSFNNIVLVDGVLVTSIQAALNALPSTGGLVIVCPPSGGIYTETLAANLVFSKPDTVLEFWCPATITMGSFQVTQASGINGCVIRSLRGWGKFGTSTGVRFVYTGNSTPFAIGDNSGVVVNLIYEGIEADISGAGSSAVGFIFTSLQDSDLRNLWVNGGGGSQVAYLLTGSQSSGNTIYNPFGASVNVGIRFAGSNTNSNTIIDGDIFSPVGASSIGLDIQNGNGNLILGVDLSGYTTGVNFGASANVFGNRVWCYAQGNTTDVVFGAGCLANFFDNIGANTTTAVVSVTDNSGNITNSVSDPGNVQMTKGGNISAQGLVKAGGVTVSAGKAISSGRMLSSGAALASAAVTGAGASGSVSLTTNSTDSFGDMGITCAGAGPAASGTLTLNFSAPLGANHAVGICLPSNANAAWNVRASFLQTSNGVNSITFAWDNNGVALVAGNTYSFSYFVFGR